MKGITGITAIILAGVLVLAGLLAWRVFVAPGTSGGAAPSVQPSAAASQGTPSDAASSIDSAIQSADSVQSDGGTDSPLQMSDADYAT